MKYTQFSVPANFPLKKISIEQAIKILNRNGIQVNEEETGIILNFLYLLSKGISHRKDKT
jgi:hypothetical protein